MYVWFFKMNSKTWTIVTSLSAALLLTAGLSLLPRLEPSPYNDLLKVACLFFGIAGYACLAAFDWMRGISVWTLHSWVGYAVYFVGNLWMYCALLWGVPDRAWGRMLLFSARLPFFLLLAPIFWLAVALTSSRILIVEANFDTPRRMWRSLVGWLYGDRAL
jgi:hypothetical protein